jgi:CheY-like chemotaxis protein
MKKYKIILVENDEDEQLFMKEGFDEAGNFDVLAQLKNGDVLFEWLDSHDEMPDIILSDLNMPGMNGYDIIDEMKTRPLHLHIPVVITSTSSTPSIIEKCINKGAAAYIIKPETFVEYVPFVENLYHLIEKEQLVK